jgi:hypothetical protein
LLLFFNGNFHRQNSEELNYSILFYRHQQNEKITKNLSYYQIASWEIFHKNYDLLHNIQNIFFKAVNFFVERIRSFGWIQIQKGKCLGGC